MKRIDVAYGGNSYSIGGRDLADVMAQIETGFASDRTQWLEVNEGAGAPRTALLALTTGTPIALTLAPDSDAE